MIHRRTKYVIDEFVQVGVIVNEHILFKGIFRWLNFILTYVKMLKYMALKYMYGAVARRTQLRCTVSRPGRLRTHPTIIV